MTQDRQLRLASRSSAWLVRVCVPRRAAPLPAEMDREASPASSGGRKEPHAAANPRLWSPTRHLLWWALGVCLVGLVFLIAFAAVYASCKASAPTSPPGKGDDEGATGFPVYFSTLGTPMILLFLAAVSLLALAGKRGTPC